MAFCEHCGKELSELAVACPQCGHPRAVPGVPVPAAPVVPFAGWGQRFAAIMLDGLVVTVPSLLILVLVMVGAAGSADPVTGEPSGLGVLLIVGGWGLVVIGGALYRILMEGGPRGATLGKMVLKIRVADAETGGPIGYGRATVRWLVAGVLWSACYIPGIVDSLFPLWDGRRQTLHDKAAGSVVVEATS